MLRPLREPELFRPEGPEPTERRLSASQLQRPPMTNAVALGQPRRRARRRIQGRGGGVQDLAFCLRDPASPTPNRGSTGPRLWADPIVSERSARTPGGCAPYLCTRRLSSAVLGSMVELLDGWMAFETQWMNEPSTSASKRSSLAFGPCDRPESGGNAPVRVQPRRDQRSMSRWRRRPPSRSRFRAPAQGETANPGSSRGSGTRGPARLSAARRPGQAARARRGGPPAPAVPAPTTHTLGPAITVLPMRPAAAC
jgi:hypothetical protein